MESIPKGLVMELAAISDWDTTGLTVTDYSKDIEPGDPIYVDVKGKITDTTAGLVDLWQAAVALAVVDGTGKSDQTLRTVKLLPSYIYGTIESLGKTILVKDILHTDLHIFTGPMPDHDVKVEVKLLANHDSSAAWNWSAFDHPGQNTNWDLLDTKTITFKIKKPTNWVLIGGLALGGTVLAALVVRNIVYK
ncbi:MAG: hypothetical protein PHU23_19595 [Dehalococcoidales bacterium]|nr:hypothetical protein [Dehalococcoidales bacterium]